MTDRSTELNKSLDDLFPAERGSCRVCGEPASPSRTRYCSERCSDIAGAVQRLFIWSEVRDRVLERDDYTCQNSACDNTDADADLQVDHIHPVADDGHPLDMRNLITLCVDCHEQKTHGTRLFTTEDAPGKKAEWKQTDSELSDF